MNKDATVELRVPNTLYERAKVVAAMQGNSFEQLICDALAEAVATAGLEPTGDREKWPENEGAEELHHYLDESGHLLAGIDTNLRPLPLPGCIAAFEGTLSEIVDFLNTFEHVEVTSSGIRSWMSRHLQQAWESGHYLVMRTHKKTGECLFVRAGNSQQRTDPLWSRWGSDRCREQ